ncbi:AsnC family transcriptional regulator [Saccharothrix sp. ALI-22-I]|uniref:Lrp/AsnC family transcriptional regulator n=1 Tax=Saccharothrix sp. ALI-22-I TaxID=1933778 RepID=UPI00097C22FA|nr:Lrp/AsnC family transcriptional regulator [Saccharothrix sp. ALI-22-I]ONI86240.1 AsnC family transcriptional regulator [Saccharothrix sp. ALI-22-I]
MDELDSAIIRNLQLDARLTNRELARRLGVAPSTCLERVRALRERGVIKGYHADVDLGALNRRVQAFVAARLRPTSRAVIDNFKSAIGVLPEVTAMYVVTGDDDFLIHLAVQDLEHLHAFLIDRLSQRREVISFRSSVIYESIHNPVLTELPR